MYFRVEKGRKVKFSPSCILCTCWTSIFNIHVFYHSCYIVHFRQIVHSHIPLRNFTTAYKTWIFTSIGTSRSDYHRWSCNTLFQSSHCNSICYFFITMPILLEDQVWANNLHLGIIIPTNLTFISSYENELAVANIFYLTFTYP